MIADFDGADRYTGARAMVFGATGFIGRHVSGALVRAAADVTLVGRDTATLEAMIEAGLGGSMVVADICDDARVVAAVRQVRPHITFNLAGYGVDRAERDDALAERVNGRFPGVLCRVVADARDADWAGQALIHVGSQLEYGPIGGNLAEDSDAAPDTLYGRTKLAGTVSLARCAKRHGLPALTARLFTVFGPGELDTRLFPSIRRAVETGQPLDMTDGLQRSDFTWIGDVAAGLLRLGVVPATAGGRTGVPALPDSRRGMVVNLASGRLLSVRDFAREAVTALGGAESLLRFGALPQRAETLEYEPVANARLRDLTGGWAPATTVAEGVNMLHNGGWTHA